MTRNDVNATKIKKNPSTLITEKITRKKSIQILTQTYHDADPRSGDARLTPIILVA